MWDQYGKAVVQERTQPQNLAELRNFLRKEFGLGTEPGYLLRQEVTEGPRRPRHRVRRALERAIRALTQVMRAPSAINGRRPSKGSPQAGR